MNKLRSILQNNYATACVLSAIAMVVISWYRVYVAGTIMVDGHGLSGLPEVIAFSVFLLSLAAFSYSYYRLWDSDALDISSVRMLSCLLAIIFSFMLPMLSNDIFSYIAFGDASNKGLDVYTNVQCMQSSSYKDYVGPAWLHSPCAYGPVVLLFSKLAALKGNGNIVTALITYKVMMLLCAFLFIDIITRLRLAARSSDTLNRFLFLLLNPVFLLQGVGQLHADIIAITLVMYAIYNQFNGSWLLAFILVSLAAATKMNYVLIFPFFILIFFFYHRQFLYIMLTGLLLAAATLALLYYPFYTSIATFTVPFQYHFHQNPSHGIAEVVGDILYYAPQLIGGKSDELNQAVNSIGDVPARQLMLWNIIVKICQAVALFTCTYLLVRFFRKTSQVFKTYEVSKRWFMVYTRCLLLFLLYYVHIFNPWHLMMLLPFLWMEEDRKFMQWLFVLTCLINVQDMVCFVSRDSIVYYLVLVLTFLSILVYVWRFKTVFIRSLNH